NTITGNPFLRPTTYHNIYAYYNAYNIQKNSEFYIYMNSDVFDDYVVAKRTVKPDLTRETTYTNVSGAYRLYGYLYYGKKVKIDSLKTVNIGPYVSTTFTRSINFNNDVQYTNLMKSVTPGFSARFIWKDVLELTPYYAISFTNNDYSLPAL